MVGYKLLAISGIDGSFEEFSLLEKLLDFQCIKYSYDRSLKFTENLEFINKMVEQSSDTFVVLGWSIGAVLSVFIKDNFRIKSRILINPFFKRSDILRKRCIFCDEEICIEDAPKNIKKMVIIRGEMDNKIPASESDRILSFYGNDNFVLYSVKDANHNLGSFDFNYLAKIINCEKGE